MSGSVNKATLVGNLGRDPEIRHTSAGAKIANLSLATSESWGHGEQRKEKTEWHRVVIWDERLADVAEKYLKKGSKVYLEGQIQTRKWTGNDGVDHYATEIVLNKFRSTLTILDARQGGEAASGDAPIMNGKKRSTDPKNYGAPLNDDFDDEIPF